MTNIKTKINAALTWCLAWGKEREPQFNLDILNEMRDAILDNKPVPPETQQICKQVQDLQTIPSDYCPEKITTIQQDYLTLWQQETPIGLVYGGATKIKQYVFEAAKLPDIRGASALLDQINLVDLPAFFGEVESPLVTSWLDRNFPNLRQALIPELIIYSTGGNILAFCPAAFVHDLANAIEKRYTEETLTANSCAVGDTFKLLEIRFGLLKDPIESTLWWDWYQENYQHTLVEAYFGKFDSQAKLKEAFQNRKSFNELAGKLASLFQMRRNGNTLPEIERPTRRFPPMFETHPHIVRDDNQHRSAITKVEELPNKPWFSDALARKRISGQKAKREGSKGQNWYKDDAFLWQFEQGLDWWQPNEVESWVSKFEKFLENEENIKDRKKYYRSHNPNQIQEAIRTEEIGNQSNGFIAFIYADGNNMGGYIQKIQTPQDYAEFSQDVSKATEQSVYYALAEHLHPYQLKDLTNPESQHRNNWWVHPFEIITIGGDDVMLIVPADKALQIAKTIGEKFEEILCQKDKYRLDSEKAQKSLHCHRYIGSEVKLSQCKLSMSTGVLITAYNTPIYYAENLTNQLLKSAKKKAKELKKSHNYYGGTIDFLALKSVTMISSNVGEFREQGLMKPQKNHTLKLYAAPYTLHEIGGLVDTIKAFKTSEFPRSQLYQIRSLIELGKQTAILNYRYFRVRLDENHQTSIQDNFEKTWCSAKTNCGNIAPWMYEIESHTYETIWREMVDLYPFIEESEELKTTQEPINKEEAQV